MNKLNLFLKRTIDIVCSIILILILTMIPFFIFVPIIIKLSSKGTILFKQVRVGKGGKDFTIYKFRTMYMETIDKFGKEILPENRITPIGKFLRATSLDEIPQLFNILFGHMSFIGPRPMLTYQKDRCIGNEVDRFLMRPGMTGWAQVKGRNNLMWEERVKYDLEYIYNFNIILDIKIIFKTINIVLKRDGTQVVQYDRTKDRFSKHYVPPKDKK